MPALSYLNQFAVKADTYIIIDLPSDVSLEGEGKSDRVVMVEAESQVSVYGITKSGSSIVGGFTAIPIAKLGMEYYIATGVPNLSNNQVAQIGLFAPYNDTTISVFTNQSILDINLNKHEAYQLQDTKDLSGTYIYSNKPVAVLSGVASLPSADPVMASEYLVEQIPDVTSLGREYVLSTLTSFQGELNYTFSIVATQPDTKVDIIGTETTIYVVLQAGDIYSGNEFGANTTLILADKAVLVVQFIQSSRVGTFMAVTPSLQMYHEALSFFVPQSDSTISYISITARCSDGEMISITNNEHSSSTAAWDQPWDAKHTGRQFCTYQKRVSSGTYIRVSVANSVHARFFVLLYGVSEHFSYGFPIAYDKGKLVG